ncbi:aldehyde ferredoxin oxidoreductase C-terminal domain-containing protein [Geomonas azotofigens]|uniref:aldehyde ferredoxin oxidoreductase C-terminal domain-containing protein n=1 Tax=Geomonas azotofigens TaxID=2843196 RepID=UPI001C111866|nr:aldehyde ferredoxin oxidoreductase C-terminal domain-containing protein [Geomonas azotofigens]MBU5613879.1 aldehyde:ferredoxin oxidoreductase [Geomonas azotofigens]
MSEESSTFAPSTVSYRRCTVNLEQGTVSFQSLPCANLEDVLGGFGRSFQVLEQRTVKNAYSPENPLIVNTGLLTGTAVMTGLRTYFSAYSPLKRSDAGMPGAMWAAGSGNFGNKLKWAGLDELIFEDRSSTPVLAVIREGASGPVVELEPADHLLGLTGHEKIMALHRQYPDAHFAVIGPAGENYQNVYMGAVVMSTDNELKSGEPKSRFAGRGGMGSVMGYKNLIAIVAQSRDKMPPVTSAMRDVNRGVITNGGSARFQPVSQGGGGGTWANIEVLQAFHAVPVNNFRPKGNDDVERLFRDKVEMEFDVFAEACFRCGIRCHNNVFNRTAWGGRGRLQAKYDFEPLILFGSNLGVHQPAQVSELIHLCDLLGMDAISLGTTLAYVLDYNERHPEAPLFNGATFGAFEAIKALIQETGRGGNEGIGRGVKRLSQQLGETSYAMHVKGLELPAYLPDTNPGYIFAIAGGHMSMGTHMLLAKEGVTTVEGWAKAITTTGLLQVGYDMIGLCKFVGAGMGHELVSQAIAEATGLKVPPEDIVAAVRRAYLRGLALELRQGFGEDEYTLPSQVMNDPNPNMTLPAFITRAFIEELKERVWSVFKPEIDELRGAWRDESSEA